jgi:hypothetical protein
VCNGVNVTECLRTVCIDKRLFRHSVYTSRLLVYQAYLCRFFPHSSTDIVPEMLSNFYFKHDKMMDKVQGLNDSKYDVSS